MRHKSKPEHQNEFSHPIRVDKIGAKEVEVFINPTTIEAIALIQRLGIVGVRKLTGKVSLNRWRVEGVQAHIALKATVTQTCGITLEPIEEDIDERFDISFLPEGVIATDVEMDDLVFQEEDLPEPIVGGIIDLGELVTQLLAVSINPYPRKTGISADGLVKESLEMRASSAEREGEARGPFSQLQNLKNRLN
jgi:uncharacterized metal-binding protein YceD (DUF177 family)